jgi:hypothetical protein
MASLFPRPAGRGGRPAESAEGRKVADKEKSIRSNQAGRLILSIIDRDISKSRKEHSMNCLHRQEVLRAGGELLPVRMQPNPRARRDGPDAGDGRRRAAGRQWIAVPCIATCRGAVAGASPGRCRAAAEVLPGCCRGVAGVLPGRCRGAAGVLRGCCRGVAPALRSRCGRDWRQGRSWHVAATCLAPVIPAGLERPALRPERSRMARAALDGRSRMRRRRRGRAGGRCFGSSATTGTCSRSWVRRCGALSRKPASDF